MSPRGVCTDGSRRAAGQQRFEFPVASGTKGGVTFRFRRGSPRSLTKACSCYTAFHQLHQSGLGRSGDVEDRDYW